MKQHAKQVFCPFLRRCFRNVRHGDRTRTVAGRISQGQQIGEDLPMKLWALNLAARVARRSSCPTYKHGAVVEKGGRVLALAPNSNVPVRGMLSTHAEFAALRRAGEAARGADIYVARARGGTSTSLSKPCPSCATWIAFYGVARVFHT